jgi:hypothetical protein
LANIPLAAGADNSRSGTIAGGTWANGHAVADRMLQRDNGKMARQLFVAFYATMADLDLTGAST